MHQHQWKLETRIKASSVEMALLGCDVSESQLLIYSLERKLLDEFSEILRVEYCEITKNIQ